MIIKQTAFIWNNIIFCFTYVIVKINDINIYLKVSLGGGGLQNWDSIEKQLNYERRDQL